jgi:hypothetical protein
LTLIVCSCSSPYKEFEGLIQQKLKSEFNGMEINYESVLFEWVDTVKNQDTIDSIKLVHDGVLNPILDLEYEILSEFGKGKIYTKEFLTKEKLTTLRNWEKNQRSRNFKDDKYKDYYEYVFGNRDLSEWTRRLCTQIEKTDSLLLKYEEIEDGNLDFIECINWYGNRIDDYWSNGKPMKGWKLVQKGIDGMREMESAMDSLSNIGVDKIAYYVAKNKYEITNPLFNNTKQELERRFKFDDKLNLMK